MPDNPNKKMDEMLRNYAEERRKSADFRLHPATRQILQGEVSRTFSGQSAPRAKWERLRAFWPQIAFAGGLCLVFGIAVLSLRQPATSEGPATVQSEIETESEKKGILSDQAQPKLQVQEQPQTAPVNLGFPTAESDLQKRTEPEPPRSPLEPAETFLRERRSSPAPKSEPPKKAEGQTRALRQQEPPRPSAARAEPENLELQQERISTTSGAAGARVGAPAEPSRDTAAKAPLAQALPSTAPAQISQRTRSAALTNLGAARRLHFVPASASALGTAANSAAPILNNFQMEQTGTNIRVYDNDGSVYLGALQPTNFDAIAESAVALQGGQKHSDNSAVYFFSAQGTNQTLRSDVVLTGRYITQTNLQPSSLDSFAISPEAKPQQAAQPRHLIIGNATLGRTNQVPIRAISIEP